MKNYTLRIKDEETFILNYKVVGTEIFIYLASSEQYIIPYTLENEKKVLERMKAQVLASSEFEIKQKKRFSFSFEWAVFNAIISVMHFYQLVTGNASIPILNGICFVFFAISSIANVYSMIDSQRKIKDIYKNKMFLDNEELLNKKVKSNQNILLNTNTKTRELVSSTPEDKPVFSLNTMDKMKYEELKNILENIRREEQFGFDYSGLEEEKAKVLTKTMTKKNGR